jgi:IclR family acetate operon transcriptional repressor
MWASGCRRSSVVGRRSSVVGGRNPAHATGVGRARLAETLRTTAAVREWMRADGPLPARPAHTADHLAEALDERTR